MQEARRVGEIVEAMVVRRSREVEEAGEAGGGKAVRDFRQVRGVMEGRA